ncbi:hypothetical protein SAMN05444380_10560 [Thermophagus xiamenensis]|uniref:Uncharacterized protein n=1 Tax=Thermophagus xiamenensis TaxID=385682 RepID=A0A1I1WWT4_9BACT|nr:hypothetical protein SAMN05444380_10560 [Thermophagus xiamenensis]
MKRAWRLLPQSTCINLAKPCEFHPTNNLNNIYTDENFIIYISVGFYIFFFMV